MGHCRDRDLADTLLLAALCWSFVLAQDMRAADQVLALSDFWWRLVTNPEASLRGDRTAPGRTLPPRHLGRHYRALGEALSAAGA